MPEGGRTNISPGYSKGVVLLSPIGIVMSGSTNALTTWGGGPGSDPGLIAICVHMLLHLSFP